MFLLLLLSIVVLLALYYLTGRYNENYWKKRGVKCFEQNKVMGPFWGFMTKDRALFEFFVDIYRNKKYRSEPAVGIGTMLKPTLYVLDPVNVQHVLQTDFASFSHRGTNFYEKDLLADNVLFMHGIRWKIMRQHLTPIFTAAKLKNMFYIIDKSAKDFVELIKQDPEKLKGDAFNTMSTFCSAAISAAVFGINTSSVFDSPFLAMAQKAFSPNLRDNLLFAIGSVFPSTFQKFKICFFSEFEDFFIGAIKQTLRQREKENTRRHDFADLCVSIQKNGAMRDPETGFELEPTDELLAAQGFFFFNAGVEPTATVMFGTLVELGKRPDIQQRLQDEIDETFEKFGGNFNYDIITEMKYLGKVFNEGARMHPPIGFLTRECVRDTVLPVGNIKVSKGTKIYTPIYEFHFDAKYYENPENFDPERFDQDNKHSDFIYQPFGKGNRICIGMRYARLQVLAGLVYLLRNFSVQTHIGMGGVQYAKHTVQVRLKNVDLEFIPRKIKDNLIIF